MALGLSPPCSLPSLGASSGLPGSTAVITSTLLAGGSKHLDRIRGLRSTENPLCGAGPSAGNIPSSPPHFGQRRLARARTLAPPARTGHPCVCRRGAHRTRDGAEPRSIFTSGGSVNPVSVVGDAHAGTGAGTSISDTRRIDRPSACSWRCRHCGDGRGITAARHGREHETRRAIRPWASKLESDIAGASEAHAVARHRWSKAYRQTRSRRSRWPAGFRTPAWRSNPSQRVRRRRHERRRGAPRPVIHLRDLFEPCT